MRRILTITVLLAISVACKSDPPRPSPAPSTSTQAATAAVTPPPQPAAPKPIRGVPKGDKELPTTSGEIAWANLEDQIKELTRLLGPDPKEAPSIRILAAQKNLHGRVRGDLDELDESIKLTTRYIELEKSPDAYLERASRQTALHRFKEAKADVEEARKKGASADAIAAVQAELDWNAGNYDPATVYFRAMRTKGANYGTLLREAILNLELGKYEDADRGFEAAEDLVTDTSPFPVAHLDMLRGIQKQKQGQFAAAVAFFREAVRRLPQHVGASEHLAETLHFMRKDDEATKLYEEITKTSNDPEFMAQLASLYRAQNKTKEADALRAKALARYDELIKKYPEAMYWHGSEFFLGEGKNPKRAVELLKKNLDLRPNATSQTALAKALLANGQATEAKDLVDKALASPLGDATIPWVAAAVYQKLGDDPKSKTLAARAKAINPQIEKIDAP
jgi:tetratricopeptide (TPR) repeat protein